MAKIKMFKLIGNVGNKILNHMKDFSAAWLLLLMILIGASCSFYGEWFTARLFIIPSLVLFVLLFLGKPLNVIFGLIGTTGVITVFVFNILIINLIFGSIYQIGFFQKAGISYDVNQPHIEYALFSNNPSECSSLLLTKRDTVFVRNLYDESNTSFFVTEEQFSYQPIDFETTLYNTIMTSLMQEPTDLFSAAAVCNNAQDEIVSQILSIDNVNRNSEKSQMFHWILSLQILISWIFFGVFISLLYSKFRYES